MDDETERKRKMHWLVVTLCVIASVGGRSAGSLLGRFYFHEGGHSYWVRTLLTSVGTPLLLIPLLINRITIIWRKEEEEQEQEQEQVQEVPVPCFPLKKLQYLISCGVLGVLVAANNFLYSLGFSYLPVSTFSLLCATQLAFTAVFSFILAKQRISEYVVNSLVVILVGAVLVGVQAKGERPAGVERGEYMWGFICTILGSALYGLIHPLLQLLFNKVAAKRSFGAVVETQVLVCTVASVVAVVGLVSSGESGQIKMEARNFKAGGDSDYRMTLVWSAISWQMCIAGSYGLVCCVSSLFSVVVSTLTLPIIPILAVFIFDDQINALKVIGMALGIWGFVSYAYGGYKESKQVHVAPPASLPLPLPLPLPVTEI